MARKKDIGTEFENHTQAYLDQLKSTGLLRYVRLYDTKSARGKYMPAQPADFIVAARGTACLLECKASEVKHSLKECLDSHVRPHQAAEQRLWARVGNPGWFIFYSQPSQIIELWDGQHVGEAYAKLRILTRPDLVVSSDSLLELLQAAFLGPVTEEELPPFQPEDLDENNTFH